MSEKTVRAKFKVDKLSDYAYGGKEVEMSPVFSNDPEHENKAFWDATPNGNLKMIVNNNSLDDFKPGDEYYLDFTKAEKVNEPCTTA